MTMPAAPAILKYGPPISLDLAKQIVAAAEAEAAAHGWPMVIALVDAGGLKLLSRHDDAQLGSIGVAQRKAETALRFKRPTKAFEDALVAGGPGLRMLSVADVCMLEGGLPIVKDGAVIGAIGVSGMQSSQDAQVAVAGLKVV
jgi:glc operon protein GlcG